MVFYILDSIRITVFYQFSFRQHFSCAFWTENTPRASIRARDSIGMNTVFLPMDIGQPIQFPYKTKIQIYGKYMKTNHGESLSIKIIFTFIMYLYSVQGCTRVAISLEISLECFLHSDFVNFCTNVQYQYV